MLCLTFQPDGTWALIGRSQSPAGGLVTRLWEATVFIQCKFPFIEPSRRSQRLSFTLFILSCIFDVQCSMWNLQTVTAVEKHRNEFCFIFLLLKEPQPAFCLWRCLISSSHCQTTSVSPPSPPSRIFCSVTSAAYWLGVQLMGDGGEGEGGEEGGGGNISL